MAVNGAARGDGDDEMGQNESKPNELVEDNAGAVLEDISLKLPESAYDLDDKTYKIVLTCRGDNRLAKNAIVKCDVGGEGGERQLKVVAGNKIYYNSPLPKPVSKCVSNINPQGNVVFLELTITKSEVGFWTTKKK